jgi:hypothetical protein
VNKILFEARKNQPSGSTGRGIAGWLGKWLEPVLQPKFAMGMAMTILSFSMLGRFAGIPNRKIQASDLEPARIVATLEDKAWRAWDRAKKYYESLRFVFEIRQTLNEWNENAEDTAGSQGGGTTPVKPDTGAAAPANSGQAAPAPSTPNDEGPIHARPQGEKTDKDGRANP